MLILALIAIIAAGGIVAYAVIMTIGWLRDKIREKLRQKNAKKVAVGDLIELIAEAAQNTDNRITLDELDKLANVGYTHFTATIDDKGQILGDVDMIKDESDTLDAEIEKLLGTKGLVTIEA